MILQQYSHNLSRTRQAGLRRFPRPLLALLPTALLSTSLTACSDAFRGTKTLAPTWFGFVETASGAYVDEDMPLAQRQQALADVTAAQANVSRFFGGSIGLPRVLICATEDCFGENRHGKTPKGQAYGAFALILSPRGLNPVILVHELTHIELHARVGTLRAWRSIPAWFDEGLAVLVSEDPRYREEAWRSATGNSVPDLNKLTWGEGEWLLNYGSARHAVGEWYARAGHDGLLRLIALLREGKDFDSALEDAE